MFAPGRKHDVELVAERLKSSDPKMRERAAQRMHFLVQEGKDPVVKQLRHQLLGAAKANDNKEGERISELIYRHVNKGKVDNG